MSKSSGDALIRESAGVTHYGTIVADPPWHYEDFATPNQETT